MLFSSGKTELGSFTRVGLSRPRGLHLLFLSVLVLASLAACSRHKADRLPAGSVVLVLGDSISAGHGLEPRQSWPELLAQRTGWRVINGGISGDTTAQGLARLPSLLERHRPAAVIIELGGNDMLRHLPGTQTVANLEAIIARVQAAGAQPILMAVPAPSIVGAAFGSLSDAEIYADLAERKHVPLLSRVIAEVLSDGSKTLDRLHPNAEGSRLLAELAEQELREAGFL
jgi:acyl-CoA thioesterase-1